MDTAIIKSDCLRPPFGGFVPGERGFKFSVEIDIDIQIQVDVLARLGFGLGRGGCVRLRADCSQLLCWRLVGDHSLPDSWAGAPLLRVFSDVRGPVLMEREGQCIFIGYPMDYKGWHFWNPQTCQEIVSDGAVFRESVLDPLHTAIPASPEPPAAAFTPPEPAQEEDVSLAISSESREWRTNLGSDRAAE